MNPVILALDMPHLSQARDMLEKVRDSIGMIKIGPELWVNHGQEALELGCDFNVPMFLDLKLHDIPNTVGKTVEALVNRSSSNYEIAFLTVHALGGREMLKAAVTASNGTRTQIAAVTLLTSLNKSDMWDFGMRGAPGSKTADLALVAQESGINTFVCSPQNIELMREYLDDDAKGYKCTLICPGIRPTNAPEDDQKRTKPVSFAIRNGADWIVIGRPITAHPDPAGVAREILAQVEKARS